MEDDRELNRLAAIWAIRALSRDQVLHQFVDDFRIGNLDALKLIGIKRRSWNMPVRELFEEVLTIKVLRQHVDSQSRNLAKCDIRKRGPFFQNLNLLGEMVGLSELEKEVLTFALVLGEEPGLQAVLESLGSLSIHNSLKELSWILKLERSELERVFEPEGSLWVSGLLDLNWTGLMSIPDRLETLPRLGTLLRQSSPGQGIETLLEYYFKKAPGPKLSLAHFPHLEKDLRMLIPFLQASLEQRQGGVNILLYGSPGTGKTELARMMAHALGARGYEVGHAKESLQDYEKRPRFRAYLLCQRLFSRCPHSLIIFDEAEDVFPLVVHGIFGIERQSGDQKGFTNHLLETNPVPAIWISNCVDQIDPSFIRRFDLVMEVPVPPRQVRRQLLRNMLEGLAVGEEWLEDMAANEFLAPGHMEKAVKVARCIGSTGQEIPEESLARIVKNAHKAMGYPDGPRLRQPPCAAYGLQYLNTNVDLEGLIQALKEKGQGRICLYGPPGTGKTEFVHFAARQLEKPLLVKRASDLLGSYVGQTERTMARMFAEARGEDGILFLDEADSFLQERNRAHHSWEVTQVNELLVQIESFPGIFFCATNFLEILDNAVFRRFDLKVRFDYLRPEQAWALFLATLEEMGESHRQNRERCYYAAKLKSLPRLTPGDFDTARRRLGLTDQRMGAENLLEGLQLELADRPGIQKHRVGF